MKQKYDAGKVLCVKDWLKMVNHTLNDVFNC